MPLPAETIIKAVNINDPTALQAVVAESGITAASKADRIASATKRTITENMEADPTFYMRFSEMLEETIRDYRQHRMSEKDYLNSIIDIASKVAGKDRGQDLPVRTRAMMMRLRSSEFLNLRSMERMAPVKRTRWLRSPWR